MASASAAPPLWPKYVPVCKPIIQVHIKGNVKKKKKRRRFLKEGI